MIGFKEIKAKRLKIVLFAFLIYLAKEGSVDYAKNGNQRLDYLKQHNIQNPYYRVL